MLSASLDQNFKIKGTKYNPQKMKKLFFAALILTTGMAFGQDPDTTQVEPDKPVEEKSKKPKIIYYQNTNDADKDSDQYRSRFRQKDRRDIKTLSGSMSHSGGFGAITFRTTDFRDEAMVMAGFRGGWIINRTLGIGVEGHGIIPTAKYDDVVSYDDAIALGGYGGMFLELIFFSNQVVHVTFPVSGGAGWLGFHEDWDNDDPTIVQSDTGDQIIDDDVFWYVEPGANVEVNVSRNFRLAFGVSQRFTQDLDLMNTDQNDFENLNYYLTLKIGSF